MLNKYWTIYGQQKFLVQYFPGDSIGYEVEFPLTSNISIKIYMWVGTTSLPGTDAISRPGSGPGAS